MKKAKKDLFYKVFFTFSTVFSFIFICHSDKLGGFFSSYNNDIVIMFLKLLIPIVLCSLSTILLLLNEKDCSFISKTLPFCIILTTIIIITDTYTFKLYGSNFMYETIHSMYFLAGVFSCMMTVVAVYLKKEIRGYDEFYKTLCISVTPIFIFIFIKVFIRNPINFDYFSVNTKPFFRINEMLDYVFNNFNVGMGQTYILLGNILFFIPLGFLIPFYLKNKKSVYQFLTGLAIPLMIEIYQFIFKCGDVDIDDIILNYLGFIAGFSLCKMIEKAVLKRKARK